MTISAPSTTVGLAFAPLAGDLPETALLVAEIGATGGGTPGQVVALNNLASAVSFFGPLAESQGTRAARKYFDLGLHNFVGLYALGLDSTGWTSNNYTLTVTGTALASGTLFVRLGSDTLSVGVTKGNDATAVAAAIAAAINGAPPALPWTATPVAGVVTVTTTLVGLATNRIDVSVDKYADRGEAGVDGISVAVVNNAVATGEAATIDTSNLGTSTHLWYLHNQVNTAFLDSLALWRDTRWTSANNWFQPIAAYATGQGAETAFTSVIGVRNDTNHTYLATADSPAYELEFVVAQLAAINAEQRERGTVPISTENRVLSVQPPTIQFDADLILQAGGTPYRENNGQTLSVQVVNSRRENAENEEDLRFFGIELVLSARELLARIATMLNTERSKSINQGGPVPQQQAPFVTSNEALTTKGRAVLVQAWKDQILTGPDQRTVESFLTFTEAIVEGGIVKGFRQRYDATLTNIARTMDAIIFLQGATA